MSDIFISYSTSDEQFAQFLHRHLTNEGLSVFLASVSLLPGQRWPQQILGALSQSSWVLFLASRAACSSPWVQQELGAAIAKNKTLVPVVWDMPPSQLPGWVQHVQALNIAGTSLPEVQAQMSAIAQRIKSDKAKSFLIGGLIVAGLFAVGGK